ncbi:MAG: hypothetical protein LBI03_07145 [Clostridiales bacterium]|jgi:hypothetical protein|nr:hypothetical protein [Clostridiales bacterium]
MKKLFMLAFCLLLVLPVFSQNVPSDIILSYQDEIVLWLDDNVIQGDSEILQFNGIDLFSKPSIHEKSPAQKVFGKGGSIIECFSLGKFLTFSEIDKISEIAYSCIPEDSKKSFLPFRAYGNFKNVLIFNPNVLFAGNGSLNDDYTGDFAYLIFYFGSTSEHYLDNVFDTQYNQLLIGDDMNFLVTPYSWYYALFRVNKEFKIELISFYGIN